MRLGGRVDVQMYATRTKIAEGREAVLADHRAGRLEFVVAEARAVVVEHVDGGQVAPRQTHEERVGGHRREAEDAGLTDDLEVHEQAQLRDVDDHEPLLQVEIGRAHV